MTHTHQIDSASRDRAETVARPEYSDWAVAVAAVPRRLGGRPTAATAGASDSAALLAHPYSYTCRRPYCEDFDVPAGERRDRTG